VAVSGANGSGKSTLFHLLTGLYRPVSGRILVGGTDIATKPPYWIRSQISVVSQETILFSQSIEENIRYSDLCAHDDDVEKAAVRAGAHDFIRSFPEGYET
jgi:ABC-type bacteriocin/lantibiotic exporter with double-glycine peptidase domain